MTQLRRMVLASSLLGACLMGCGSEAPVAPAPAAEAPAAEAPAAPATPATESSAAPAASAVTPFTGVAGQPGPIAATVPGEVTIEGPGGPMSAGVLTDASLLTAPAGFPSRPIDWATERVAYVRTVEGGTLTVVGVKAEADVQVLTVSYARPVSEMGTGGAFALVVVPRAGSLRVELAGSGQPTVVGTFPAS